MGIKMNENSTIELKQSNTTISIKRGTKAMLDELAARRDSYDDVIKSLIRKVKQEEPKPDASPTNVLKISQQNQRKSALRVSNSERIEFVYQAPKLPLDKDYRFMVTYTKVIYKNKEAKGYYKNTIEMAYDYLRIIEMIIQKNIDPMFRIDKKHLLDLNWWRRMFTNLGLSYETYKNDIEYELIKRGVVP